jgi:hypothetical protein
MEQILKLLGRCKCKHVTQRAALSTVVSSIALSTVVSSIALRHIGGWPTTGSRQYNLNLGLQITFIHRTSTYISISKPRSSRNIALRPDDMLCLKSLSASGQFDGVLAVNGVLAPVEPLLHPLVVLPPRHLHLLPLFPPLRQALPFQHPDHLGHGRAVLLCGLGCAICIIISTSCRL